MAAAPKLSQFGFGLIDVGFMRINYSPSVTAQINNRMISERKQIADRFRAEGEGKAGKIIGKKEREFQQIKWEAYEKAQAIKGQANAEASGIYAKAYNQSPASVEFYGFLQTMDTYKRVATNDMMLVLSTDGDIFKYLKSVTPAKQALTPKPSANRSAEKTKAEGNECNGQINQTQIDYHRADVARVQC